MDYAILLFTDSTSKALHMLKPGFKHVITLVYKEEAGEWAIVVDSRADKFDVYIEPRSIHEVLIAAQERGVQWALVPIKHPPYRRLAVWPCTCVGMAKNAIGMRNLFIQTPYQLYNYLNRGGHHAVTNVC